MTQTIERRILIALNAFLAVTAIGGGLAILTRWIDMPVEWLSGSPFASYDVPGLALLVVVGGSALVATMAVLTYHPWSVIASALAGLAIIGFEVVEVAVVGLTMWLQPFYFIVGLVIVALAVRQELREPAI